MIDGNEGSMTDAYNYLNQLYMTLICEHDQVQQQRDSLMEANNNLTRVTDTLTTQLQRSEQTQNHLIKITDTLTAQLQRSEQTQNNLINITDTLTAQLQRSEQARLEVVAQHDKQTTQITLLKQIIQRHAVEEQKLQEVYLNRKQAFENIHNEVPLLDDPDTFKISDENENLDYISAKHNNPMYKKFEGSYCIETQRYLDAIQLHSSQYSVTILMTINSSPEGDKQYNDTSEREQEELPPLTHPISTQITSTDMDLINMDTKELHTSPPTRSHLTETVIVPEVIDDSVLNTETDMQTDDTPQSVSERRQTFLRSIRFDYFQNYHLSETAHTTNIIDDPWLDIDQLITETLPTQFYPALEERPTSSSEQDKYENALSQARQDHATDLLQIAENRNHRQRMLLQWVFLSIYKIRK